MLELVDGAGLTFQNWIDNLPYWRNGAWAPDSAIAAAVDSLPPREHWAAVEMLGTMAGMHMSPRVGPVKSRSSISTEPIGAALFRSRHPAFQQEGTGLFRRGPYELKCSDLEQFVLDGADGKRTIGEIIDVPALADVPIAERDEFARRYFEHLWKLGHVMIALP